MRKFLSILMACCFFLPVINAQTVGEQSSFEKMKKKLLKSNEVKKIINGYKNAAYERALEKKIIEILEPSYSVVRTLPDGSNEFQSIFLIDEREARKLRKSAIEAAIEESGVDEEYINLLKTEVETIVNT